jgi:hypothetical protein
MCSILDAANRQTNFHSISKSMSQPFEFIVEGCMKSFAVEAPEGNDELFTLVW